jgi:hypothetical protein
MKMSERECLQVSEAIRSVADDPFLGSIFPESQPSVDGQTRLRIWEIEDRFKCPMIGWCFDISEQKEVLRKGGVAVRDLSHFRIHEIVVESLEEENLLSQRIDTWLNRKYQKEIREFSSLAQEEFIKHWKESIRRGDVVGILWVAVTKADLSTEAKRIIFGDVHMEMHVRAKQIGHERQKLDQEREKNKTLAESVREVSRTNRNLRRENEALRNELAIACRHSDTLQRRNQELERELSMVKEDDFVAGLQKENTELRAERVEFFKQMSALQRELRRLQNQNKKLLFKLNKPLHRIHGNNESESPVNQKPGPDSHHPGSSLDLSQMCVLVVGGLPPMEPLYRRLIEKNSGIFEYHDGRVSTGVKELVNQVMRAELVLCCIDHSSHTAALVVKKLCKRHRKPFRMLINSSLNNILLTLVAIQKELTPVQNGEGDSYNDPFKHRPQGRIMQKFQRVR